VAVGEAETTVEDPVRFPSGADDAEGSVPLGAGDAEWWAPLGAGDPGVP
jgi:hypothetical protein